MAEEIEEAVCPRRGVASDFETAKWVLTSMIDEARTERYPEYVP